MPIQINGFYYWLEGGALMRSLANVEFKKSKQYARKAHNLSDVQLSILNLLIERTNDENIYQTEES